MSSISLVGSADVWSYYNPFRAERAASANNSVPASAVPKGPSATEVRGRLASSATALRNAFQFLSQHLRRMTMPTLEGSAGTRGTARATIVPAGIQSILHATREVNGNLSAAQTSAASLGLDVTSPEAKSFIESLAAMGLDVTSAERSTTLRSSGALGLDTTTPESASVLRSTEEANTMPTSYGVVQATFGTSSSAGSITGVYAGTGAAANATSLTLTVSSLLRNINNIPNLVSVAIKDQNGTNLGTVQGAIRAGEALSLGSTIGLSIAFSAGTLQNGSSSTFSVSRTTPTDIDPNAVFNAANINDRPRFENGAAVTAGTFSVNGTSVQVLANDSVNSVLQRINSTVSGVIATYQNDRVVLQSSGPSEDNIAIANDTSGFFTALKLNGAITTRGNVRDDLQVFSKTSQFSSITAGNFRINGQTIAINPATDSLSTVLNQINNSAAGVIATYDSTEGKIVLTTAEASEDAIVVDNDTSGFLAAAGLSTLNSSLGNIRDDRQVLEKVSAFATMSNGSFQVNGAAISIDISTDTLESILAEISNSSAGVDAIYDAGVDRLVLSTRANSEDDIVLSGDSSGFLAATHMEGAITSRGNLHDDSQALAGVAQFSEVTAGSFRLNGVEISIDPENDSLEDILSRINAAGAGVSARYDSATQRVTLDPGANPLVLENDSSGFLGAIEIGTGAFSTRVNENGAFNGTGMGSAFLEDGFSVSAGSFTVNGVEIEVNADDTVQSVLGKITQSSAGVVGSFDSGTETVTLRSKKAGDDEIVLGTDTSGFLAAMKLDGTAEFTAGRAGESLSLREAAPAASSASIVVNDEEILIDLDLDSIQSLAEKLNDIEGVEAFLDSNTGALTIRSEEEGGSVVIQDGSGVLQALGINDGTYTGEAPTFRTVHSKNSKFQISNREKVVDKLVESFEAVNQALSTVDKATGLTLAFRDDLQDVLRDSLESIHDARGKGLIIVNEAGKPLTLRVDRSLLSNALRQNARVLEPIFKGRESLPDALEDLAENASVNFMAAPASRIIAPPTPAAVVAGDVAEDFYKVGSASQLFIIDSVANAGLTPSEDSPVLEIHEPDPPGHMEGA